MSDDRQERREYVGDEMDADAAAAIAALEEARKKLGRLRIEQIPESDRRFLLTFQGQLGTARDIVERGDRDE
ncbi:hypothetical protein [Halarchaeum nitratireducens]|uniref:Uncharacterized protein n=1 Tax=Halarchaeum nitratireducens TaxID=489913 RepID=A0A830GD60_9EURY|nr:hypothetical protein [Halarchaeum nitratireducens]GGN18552.1 hypothetical protein GCM10009021_19440 [Halarchaeum nitratireducens]